MHSPSEHMVCGFHGEGRRLTIWFLSPEREQVAETSAPVTYCTLQHCHLDQVHDLLARVFWDGINGGSDLTGSDVSLSDINWKLSVSDSLDYMPEKCTVIATYKQLVVGAAFLSSPQEDRKSTRLNSSHSGESRMPSSA